MRKMRALTMQMETMTLIGNSKYNLTCFPWQTWFFCGGRLRSESSCIWVNLVFFFSCGYVFGIESIQHWAPTR